MPTYVVQGCTILGNEILDAYEMPNFDCIFFKLERDSASPNSLNVKVYAADTENNPLPDGNVDIFSYNTNPVRLRNEWIERPLKITKVMLDDVTNGNKKILSIQLTGRRYTHYKQGHQDHDKDFISYKVRLSKENLQ
jgi:hypothetical protein